MNDLLQRMLDATEFAELKCRRNKHSYRDWHVPVLIDDLRALAALRDEIAAAMQSTPESDDVVHWVGDWWPPELEKHAICGVMCPMRNTAMYPEIVTCPACLRAMQPKPTCDTLTMRPWK